jgi:hypothetical protein
MSCDGWGVGDRCRCVANFEVDSVPIGPGVGQVRLRIGDMGVIQKIIDRIPHSHIVMVFWSRLNQVVPIPDHQLGFLEVLP